MNKTLSVFFLLLRTLLQFVKKKRRRSDDFSDCDIEVTPPNSPIDDIDKRRSSRNANKRKKYVDDVDLNLSDDESILAQLPADIAAELKAAADNGTSEPVAAGADASAAAGSKLPSAIQSEENSLQETAAPQVAENSTPQSGPNYAFIVSLCIFVQGTFSVLINTSFAHFFVGSAGRGWHDSPVHSEQQEGNERVGE
jgi:hypothetical protein